MLRIVPHTYPECSCLEVYSKRCLPYANLRDVLHKVTDESTAKTNSATHLPWRAVPGEFTEKTREENSKNSVVLLPCGLWQSNLFAVESLMLRRNSEGVE